MLDLFTLTSEIQAMEEEVISFRRQVHRMAETGGVEVRTNAFIKEKLTEFGIPYDTMEGTGILGIIDTGKEGPHIGLRADFDALPVPEDACNLKKERVVISDTPDKTCHACGHDAHTAMLLGAAKILSKHKEELEGIIYLSFESGEEIGAGYGPMMKALEQYHVDTFWAIHVLNYIPAGQICVQAGPRMAGGGMIDVTFIGKGGHGSRPDLSANPVFCAANFVTNLATAFVNQIDANETVTLGVTSIQGGEAANIFPDTAKVIGTIRFYSQSEGKKALDLIKKVAEGTASYSKCRAEFGPWMNMVGTPLINDEYYADMIEERLKGIIGEEKVVHAQPWYASESFSRYLQNWPGVMAHLGIKNDEYGSGAEHHNSKFDVDESVLSLGVLSTVEYVLGVIENGLKPE